MADIVSLAQVRERRLAREHARAVVLHECAVALVRQGHSGLEALIEQAFGAEWIERRVREIAEPRRRDDAPALPRAARR